MIKYIMNDQHKGIIFSQKKDVYHNLSYTLVDNLCINYLTTYRGYIKAIRKLFKINRGIPIVLSESLILFPIKSVIDYDNVWINYVAIKAVQFKDSTLSIRFYDDTTLQVKYSKHQYTVTKKRIEVILKYKRTL